MTKSVAPLATALADRYRVERAVGRGGMATVYLADDVKHGRKVALKVLHPELAAALGTERFLAEIRTTAALQHPNILPLFDSGEADGLVFYVMPFVEGESLRERLAREQQLPVDEAVRIAQQVAGALDHAHRHGIIHRDIKPENILLSEGQPLVADFGIALAVSSAGGSRLTQTGLSVGTPQYMSPEQAAAEREVDRRTDIYSLGAVLYEMLAGAPPFTGPTAAAITARKLTETVPPLRTVRDTVPSALEAVVRKALARTPADRFATAQEFAQALDLVRSLTSIGVVEPMAPVLSTPRARPWIPWALAAVSIVAAGTWTVITRWGNEQPHDAPPVEFPLPVAPLAVSTHGNAPVVRFSPDGRSVAYVSGTGGDGQLFIRRLDAREPIAVSGVTRAAGPFFSPDGQWIGYADIGDGMLKKVRVTGGTPMSICKAVDFHGGTWSGRGMIAFAADGPVAADAIGIWVVSADGGAPRFLARPDSATHEEAWLTYPSFLPDNRAVLYTTLKPSALGLNISVLDIETGAHRIVTSGGGWARYVAPGYLVYAQDGGLLAARFDARSAKVVGAPVKVRSDIMMNLPMEYGLGHFDVSSTGTLAYLAGAQYQREGDGLAWADRGGRLTKLPDTGIPIEQLGLHTSFRVSPEGRRLLISGVGEPLTNFKGYPVASQLYVYDIARGTLTRLVPDKPSVWMAEWLPDGQRVVAMISDDDRVSVSLFLFRADGLGVPERLTRAPTGRYDVPWSVTADGKRLFYYEHAGGSEADVWSVALTGERRAEPILNRPVVNELDPAISPDGRWLAYVSNESGRAEVYLTDYPARAHRWQVSTQGGEEPTWNSTGRELFFLLKRTEPLGSVVLWSVPFTPDAKEPLGRPVRLFETMALFVQSVLTTYTPAPGGQRFLVMPNRAVDTTSINHLTIVVNWTTELRAAVR